MLAYDTRLKYRLLSALFGGLVLSALGVAAASLLPNASSTDHSVTTAARVRLKKTVAVRRPLQPARVQNVALRAPQPRSLQPAPSPAGQPPSSQRVDANLPPLMARSDEDLFRDVALPTGTRPSDPKVAIIIDDLGHSKRHNRGALSLPPQVAFAILPYAQYAAALARDAAVRGHELIVHMPMQPKNESADPGPNALRTDQDVPALRTAIVWNLNQFSGYVAVNNHMGSRFTEDQRAMRILFEELADRGLSFYDSRTTASSASVPLAARFDVAFAERDVFLDNERQAVSVDRQLAWLETLAKRNGTAIAIGHPHKVTYDQIRQWAQTLEERGLTLVPPSTIVAERQSPFWRRRLIAAADGAR